MITFLIVPPLAGLNEMEKEQAALKAYRSGSFFGLIGAMHVNADGKPASPYDYREFRFSKIAVNRDNKGRPVGLDVCVKGNDVVARPHVQIRFVTDQGVASIVDNDEGKAFFDFPKDASGRIRCRFVRIEAFAYPEFFHDKEPFDARCFSEMDVFQIAGLKHSSGGNKNSPVVDMLFSQPLLIREQ